MVIWIDLPASSTGLSGIVWANLAAVGEASAKVVIVGMAHWFGE